MSREPITPDQFRNLIKENKPIKNVTIKEAIVVNASNCETSGKRLISITNSDFASLDIRDNEIESFSLVNCQVTGTIEIGVKGEISKVNCQLCNIAGLHFVSMSHVHAAIKHIQITQTKIQYLILKSINIYHALSIGEKLDPEKGVKIKTKIDNLVIDGAGQHCNVKIIHGLDFRCRRVRLSEINSENCIFDFAGNSTPTVQCNDSKITQLRFRKSRNGTIAFTKCKFDALSFAGYKQFKLTLNSSEARIINFELSSLTELKLTGQGKYENVEHTYIDEEASTNGEGAIEHMPCKDLKILGLSLSDNISFTNFHFGNVYFESFSNTGTIRLNNSKVLNRVMINSSSMGKTIFNNFSIKKQQLYISDSNIEEMEFYNFDWQGDYSINEVWRPESGRSEEKHRVALREAYRQLKNGYSKHGNKIESLEFQRREFYHHYYLLKEKTLRFFQKQQTKENWELFKSNLGDYLILGTHKWSSSFGLNVWWPAFFLFFFHLIFFAWLVGTNCDFAYKVSICNWDWDSTKVGFKDYFQTILPTHPFIIQHSLSERILISGPIDFLMRVSSGYFIFYFISSSRKYHQS